MIEGEPFPYALARIPAAGESRGNLAAGGTGKGVELSTRDHWICDPEIGGGRILGEACHFVDLIVFLTEQRITRVFASGARDGSSTR